MIIHLGHILFCFFSLMSTYMFTGIKASRKFVMGKFEMGKTSWAASFSHQQSEAASLPSLGQNTRMEL